MVAALPVRASSQEKCLRSNLRSALIDEIFEDGALGLWMDLDTAILVALAMDGHRARHLVAFNHICQPQTTDFTAADASVEQQEEDGGVAKRIRQLLCCQVDHAPDINRGEASLGRKLRLLEVPPAEP